MKAIIYLNILVALSVNSLAFAEAPRCFLHGILVPNHKESAKTKLDDNLRLQFDSIEKADCEAKISSYCKYHVINEEYLPTKLEGYFRDNGGKKSAYRLSDKCKILRDSEENN